MIKGIIKTRAINKGCLQKLHSQTRHNIPKEVSHVIIRPAQRNRISSVNDKVFWESAAKLRLFVLAEEQEIRNKYNHKKSDSVVSLEKRQEQSIADGRCVGANRINKDPQGFSRITFIGTVDSCHQVMIPKALPV